MKVKQGASIEGCRAPILIAFIKIEPLFVSRGIEMVITSGHPGVKHSADRSGHYRGDGGDLRTRDLPVAERPGLVKSIRRKLGPDYVVILESDHIHIHWSPIYH